ncbi:MAG: cell cycle transcriptional regulator TrcR [Pseudomonadota bacterium]
MNLPLMPKATAVWLIENTTLTFDQIAVFCGLHPLEVKGIADGEVAIGIAGENPINREQLTKEEIKRCEANEDARLLLSTQAQSHIKIFDKKKKTAHYTPIAKRQDKPDAVSWFIRYYPTVTDQQIVKLIGTTKSTINAIKARTHWNMNNIKPRDPVLLGLCSQTDLDKLLEKAKAQIAEEAPQE